MEETTHREGGGRGAQEREHETTVNAKRSASLPPSLALSLALSLCDVRVRHHPSSAPHAAMVKTKSKLGFTAKSTSKPKPQKAIAKKSVPSDPVEALILQSKTALSMSDVEKAEAQKKAKKKAQQAKARRSVVRKQQKKRQAGAKRKQRRKGIN